MGPQRSPRPLVSIVAKPSKRPNPYQLFEPLLVANTAISVLSGRTIPADIPLIEKIELTVVVGTKLCAVSPKDKEIEGDPIKPNEVRVILLGTPTTHITPEAENGADAKPIGITYMFNNEVVPDGPCKP